MVTAVLYTPDTTLDGVEEIRAAEVLEATPDRVEVRQQETLELEDYLDPDFVSRYPVESLRLALETSVSESWTDTNHRLLLSGGLDSRTVLMLAGPGRKTVTIGRTEIGEALIARSIAESCAADENGADKLDHRAAILSRVRAERN
jgi:asparagine synthetase B (glutamine-hydrolysing)